MKHFTFSEAWGPFRCEHPNCSKETFTIRMKDAEWDELPEPKSGPDVANVIITQGIGVALCDEHMESGAVCTCLANGECDCDCPEPEQGAALVSNSCPVHNLYPDPDPTCPVHSQMERHQFTVAFEKETKERKEQRVRATKQAHLEFQ